MSFFAPIFPFNFDYFEWVSKVKAPESEGFYIEVNEMQVLLEIELESNQAWSL